MNPVINKTSFGSITVNGESYDHDIIISLDGKIKKRKKKLSKAVYGTSHNMLRKDLGKSEIFQTPMEGKATSTCALQHEE